MVPVRERTIFDAMKASLNVDDNPRSIASLKFSRDNLCQDGCRCLARLDRLYLFNSQLPSDRQLLHYSIRGDITQSDHHSVTATIQLEDRPHRPSKWKMNSSLLDEAFVEYSDRWKVQPVNAPFFTKMRSVLKYYREFCKGRAAALRADEDTLKQELEAATFFFQQHEVEHAAQTRRGEACTSLEQFQARRIAGRKARSRLRWKLKGDMISREFFLATKERPQTATIGSLRNKEGEKVSVRRRLEHLVTSFYAKLYTAPAESPEHHQAEDLILQQVPNSFSTLFPESVLAHLARDPDEAELKAALDSMATGRSPGAGWYTHRILLKVLGGPRR
jgi:hypothetical protein